MPISPTTYWMNQIVLSWWNYLWFLLLRQLPKRNVRKVTKIVSFSLIYFCFFCYFSLSKSNKKCLLVKHHLLLLSKLHSLIIVSVCSCCWQFFFVTKGLKIITKLLNSPWRGEISVYLARLVQPQGSCFPAKVKRWQVELDIVVQDWPGWC